MDGISEKKTLKVVATFKELDYAGNVLTRRLTTEIPWRVSGKHILKHIVENGTMRGFPRPFGGYFNDLMETHFGITEHDKVWRSVSVESETLPFGAKFVFQRHGESAQVMEWEDVR